MFENVVLCKSENTANKFNELKDILTEDPVFKEYLAEDKDLQSLKEYVQSDTKLTSMVVQVGKILTELTKQAKSGPMGDFGLDELHEVISNINLLNGYDTDLQSRNTFRTQYSRVQEKTEKTLNASMTEKVYAFMDKQNYGDIQSDPRAQVLIHLAHLTEKMMDKLPELVRMSDLEKAEKSMSDAKAKETPTDFFKGLNQLQIDCILDENVLKQEMEKNEARSKKNDDFLKMIKSGEDKEFNKSFTEENFKQAREELITLAKKNHPNLLQDMEREQELLAGKYTGLRNAEVRKVTENYRKALIAKNNSDKGDNERAELDNKEPARINRELDGKIEVLKQQLEEKRKVFTARKEKAAAIREEIKKKVEADYNKALADYNKDKEELPVKREALSKEVHVLRKYWEASEYLNNEKNNPPQEHFDTLRTLDDKRAYLNNVRNIMFDISNRKRGAEGAEKLLSQATIDKVKDLREKRDKALRAEQEIKDKLETNGNEKKQAYLLKQLNKATKEREEAEKAFAPWQGAANLQAAVGDLWNKYPDVRDEFKNRLQKEFGKNAGKEAPEKEAYRIFGEMYEDYGKKMTEEKKNYRKFYESADDMQTIGKLVMKNKVRDVKELSTAEKELKDVETKISKLAEPKYDPDNQIWTASKKIYDDINEPKEMQKYELDTQAQIQDLKGKRKELKDVKAVLSEAEIDAMVKEYEAEQKDSLTGVYNARLTAEQNEIRASTLEALYDEGKKDVHNESVRLRDKNKKLSETVETAKKKYDAAVRAYNTQEEIKRDYSKVKDKPLRFADMMEKELSSLYDNIDKGKKAGHHDTKEFTRMRESLSNAHKYLQNEENRKKLDALDKNSVDAFKGLLTKMKDESANYWAKKQTGIHWNPSNMRFVRLNMANRLQSTADEMSKKFTSLQELKTKENELNGKVGEFKIEEPGSDYIDFTKKNTSGAKKTIDAKKPEKKPEKKLEKKPVVQGP